MNITMRHYKPLRDFEPIRQFLIRNHQPDNADGNFYPSEWEYMHTHSLLPYEKLWRFGIWENEGEIVGVANFEWFLGEAMFQISPQYSFLKEAMLDHAEAYFTALNDAGERYLRVARLYDGDAEMQALLTRRGYALKSEEWVGFYELQNPVPDCPLPEGFEIISLAQENDLKKIDRVMWRGFNHEGEPTGDEDGRRIMQTGPRFDPALNLVVKAPNGEYAVYCGMWYEAAHREAYLEPLCTDPDYRKLGLGKAALYEAMRRARRLGALRCLAGGQPFYEKVGFVEHYRKQDWIKIWDNL